MLINTSIRQLRLSLKFDIPGWPLFRRHNRVHILLLFVVWGLILVQLHCFYPSIQRRTCMKHTDAAHAKDLSSACVAACDSVGDIIV